MKRPDLSRELAELVLDGRIDDVPAAWRDVASLLADVRVDDAAGIRSAVVDAMVDARDAASLVAEARTGRRRIRVALSAMATALVLTLAAGGALPASAQRLAHDVLRRVGITVPDTVDVGHGAAPVGTSLIVGHGRTVKSSIAAAPVTSPAPVTAPPRAAAPVTVAPASAPPAPAEPPAVDPPSRSAPQAEPRAESPPAPPAPSRGPRGRAGRPPEREHAPPGQAREPGGAGRGNGTADPPPGSADPPGRSGSAGQPPEGAGGGRPADPQRAQPTTRPGLPATTA